MAYKKYIERNGKIYGPYVYHSRRVNGKVVSEYRGPKEENVEKKKKFKKLFLIFGFLTIIFLFFSWGFFLKPQLTGRVALNFEQTASEGIDGNIDLIFHAGELIPADTLIILENGGNTYEYVLSDFILEEPVVGNYYLEGLDVVGEGPGFGLIGTREEIVPVFFKLEIQDLDISSGEGGFTEIIPENVSEENLTELNVGDLLEEPSQDNGSGVLAGEGVVVEDVPGETPEFVPEVLPEEESSLQEAPTESEKGVVEEAIEKSSFVSEEEVSGGGLTITGDAIRARRGIFSNIFTGRVIEENELIQGDVSKGEEFKQNILSGKTVTIVPGSVLAEEMELEENVLNLEILDGEVTVTTNYSIVEEGFGDAYFGDEESNLLISLYSLNISFVEGPITIKGIYGELNIFYYEGNLQENFSIEEIPAINETEISNESLDNLTELNVTDLNLSLNLTNETILLGVNLTDQELFILMKEFGTTEVEISVQKYRDKFLVELVFGEFSLKHYYPETIGEEDLKIEIERDKIIWLKDFARELGKDEIVLEEVIL